MFGYYFILVPLDKNMSDMIGNIYPSSGKVQSKRFTKDQDLRFGLFGYLWGKNVNYTIHNPKDVTWAIVRIDNVDNVISDIEANSSLIKFESGTVLMHGTLNECCDYILSHQKENQYPDPRHTHKFNIAGTIMSDKNHCVFTEGYGQRISVKGYKNHSITCGKFCRAETNGEDSNAVSFGDSSESVSMDDRSVAFTSGHDARSSCIGEDSISISTGSDSISISNGNGLSMVLGIDGTASAGKDGVIILAYQDGDKKRFKVGYVGEDILEDTLYKLDDKGEFVLALE